MRYPSNVFFLSKRFLINDPLFTSKNSENDTFLVFLLKLDIIYEYSLVIYKFI